MGHDGVDGGVLGRCLVEIHRDVDALLFNELGHAVAHFLGESAIGTPRVGAVDIPGLI